MPPRRPVRQAPLQGAWYAKPVKCSTICISRTTEYRWALTTSTASSSSTQSSITPSRRVSGLEIVCLDPHIIRSVSHAHYDHVGGASYLQDRFNAKWSCRSGWTLLEARASGEAEATRATTVEAHLGEPRCRAHHARHTLGPSTLHRFGRQRSTCAYWGHRLQLVTNATVHSRGPIDSGSHYINSPAFRPRANAGDVVLSTIRSTAQPSCRWTGRRRPHPYVSADRARYLTSRCASPFLEN